MINERRSRWDSLHQTDGGINRLFIIDYDETPLEEPEVSPQNRRARVDWALASYERQIRRCEWLKDDSLPCLWVKTGTEIFAEALGCEVYRPTGTMPSAIPMITDPEEVESVKVPDISESSLALLFDIADELRSKAGESALLRLVDIQSPMDIAALVWDKNHFFPAMISHPEAVKALAQKAYLLLTSFLDNWFERYGPEFIAHYPDYYMPYGITVSEDEIGSVSPAYFNEFFLPWLDALSDRYGMIGVHCCATARHQWENLKSIQNISILNLVRDAEETKEAYDFFADSLIQIHHWCGDGDPSRWSDALPEGSKVVLRAGASTRDEALRLSEVFFG